MRLPPQVRVRFGPWLERATGQAARQIQPVGRAASRNRSGGSAVPRAPVVVGPLNGERRAWISLDELRSALSRLTRSEVQTLRDVPAGRARVQVDPRKPDMAVGTQQVEGGPGDLCARELPVVRKIARNLEDA